MVAILIYAALVGPLPDPPVLTLRIHLGRDHRSRIALAELSRNHPWWNAKRRHVQEHYRIIVDDQANDEPTWQIGTGDERHKFPPGTFIASGSFWLCLESITGIDYWERHNPFLDGNPWPDEDTLTEHQRQILKIHLSTRPEQFPSIEEP